MVNNVRLNVINKQFFNIGDLIYFSSENFRFVFFYEKFFILFNILFTISPLLFKNKQQFLYKMYNKMYVFYNSRNVIIHFGNNMNMTSRFSNHLDTFLSDINKNPLYSRIFFFIHLLNKMDLCYKNYIKTIFFFFRKYNLLFSYTFDFNFKNKSSLFNNTSSRLIQFIYSFDKSFIKYKLLDYESSAKKHFKRIRKPF
jgi:hypothetical protein